MKPQRWTAHDHAKFEQGLEKYGRDWKSIAEYVGNRSATQIYNHAGHHFLCLLRDGKPLPPKVAESGIGFDFSIFTKRRF